MLSERELVRVAEVAQAWLFFFGRILESQRPGILKVKSRCRE